MSLQGAVDYLNVTLSTLPGLRKPDKQPQDNINAVQSYVIYPGAFVVSIGDPSGQVKYLGTITVDIFSDQKSVSRAYAQLVGLLPQAITRIGQDITFGDEIQTFADIQSPGIVSVNIGAVDYWVLRLQITQVEILMDMEV